MSIKNSELSLREGNGGHLIPTMLLQGLCNGTGTVLRHKYRMLTVVCFGIPQTASEEAARIGAFGKCVDVSSIEDTPVKML